MKLLKLSQVVDKLSLSRCSVYKLIKRDTNPLPRPINVCGSRWVETELDQWIIKEAEINERRGDDLSNRTKPASSQNAA